jgi:RsiW-degrading membrane proteinase PrsW (M82 family)
MIIAYTLISLFGAWIWFKYFQFIDIFERERNRYFIISFICGALSVVPVIALDKLVGNFYFNLDGTWLGDFFFSFIEIGLVEESSKVLAFGLAWLFIRKQLNEPLDYIYHISIVALGFSTVENIKYFNSYGVDIINSRIVMASFGHIFNTSLFAYGIIYSRFRHPKVRGILPLVFLLLAGLTHGIYDFVLLHDFPFNSVVFMAYFFLMVSVFSTVLNNAMNLSPYFTYNLIVHPRNLMSKLMMYYGIFLALQFSLIAYNETVLIAIYKMFSGMLYVFLVMLIILGRLSRFKLIQNRWKKIRLELPFSIKPSGGFALSIRGDGMAEADVAMLFGKPLLLCPLSYTNSTIDAEIPILIQEKLFLYKEEVYYRVSLEGSITALPKAVFLKAKTFETTRAYQQYPIVAILYPHDENASIEDNRFDDFQFVEWAYLKEAAL